MSTAKKTKIALVVVAVIVATAAAFNAGRIQRLYRTVTLFARDDITRNFRSAGIAFDSRVVRHGPEVFQFKRNPRNLPGSYEYRGNRMEIAAFIERYWTTGLIVIKDDTILFERYYRGNSETSTPIVWSVSKSFTSALFGIAVGEGHITDITRAVTDYLPVLKSSGYNGVRIKDVLQMSSGVRFDENYGAFHSDINRMSRSFALNLPLVDLIAALPQERTPGAYFHYMSMDTQVLGMMIVKATGRPLADYAREKIWTAIGMESDARWLIDSSGMETAFGGLCVSLRDLGRFGRLYLKKGNWNGKQVVPAEWVRASQTPDAPHLKPGKRVSSKEVLGYGYQWWIPLDPDGEFLAMGVYGQAIYIYPRHNIVIARTSAYPDYTKDGEEMEMQSIEVYRAIAKKLGK